jgi:RND superfamily putative drug exporter
MAEKHPIAILPSDAPSNVTARKMTEAFHESGSENLLLVVLTDDKGLGPADEATYRKLVDALRADTRDVLMLQDFVSTPPLRSVVTSEDHKAWVLPVGVAGELGTPRSYAAFNQIGDIVKHGVTGTPLTANLTGPAATVADLTIAGDRDRLPIELAIAVLVLIVLLLVYRSAVTMLLPLVTIGLSLVIAQAVVAGYSQLTGSGVSNQSIIFLSAIMAGAGTDYAVFLISRYHDYLRSGADFDEAVKKAMISIGKVITASATTVGITFLLISFARMGVFKTVGVASAIGIGVAFLAALTLLPAILVLAGPRGWVKPRRELTARLWRRSGIRIVRRPVVHLAASLLVLAILASCAGLLFQAPSGMPRWTAISRSISRFRSTSSFNRRMTCARRRPLPTWNRWRTASVNCRISPLSAALLVPPEMCQNNSGPPIKRAPSAPFWPTGPT